MKIEIDLKIILLILLFVKQNNKKVMNTGDLWNFYIVYFFTRACTYCSWTLSGTKGV